MNGEVIVLDTNFVVYYLKGNPAHVSFIRGRADDPVWLSVISEVELFSFHALTEVEKNGLNFYISTIGVMPLDNRVKRIAIDFRRATRCKVPDAITAATAISLKACLVTSDQKLLKSAFPGFEVQSV